MEEDVKDLDEIIFGILSEKDIRDISVCKVDNPKLTNSDKNGGGYGTVYDPRMGPIENNKPCETCGFDIWRCPGHYGFIELYDPIIHPLFYKRVVDFLRCVCIKCNSLLITEDQIKLNNLSKIKSTKRFDKILEKIEKIDMCPNCSHPQPDIKYTSADNNISMVYKQKDKGKISIVIPVDDIKKTFENLTDDNVRLLGFDPSLVHPKSLIITLFPVLPYCCRPFVLADGQTCDDDLTIQLVEIIKVNNHLKIEDGIPLSDTKRQKYIQTLKFRISTFYNNSQSRAKHTTSGRPIKGLKERITGKEGLIRSNIMGKRCWKKGTKMLLWNGENKNVEDIKIGDILIGNDGTPRNVLNLHNGVDKLYKIKQETREDYIVNSEHLLSLKYTNKEKIYSSPNLYYTQILDVFDKNTLTRKLIEFKEDINLSYESRHTKFQDFLDRLDYDNTLNISIKDYLQLPNTIKKRLFSYKIEKPVEWEYKKTDVDPYDLGLWLGNSNKNIVDCPNDKLKKYSLLDTKFIPKDFIYNSKQVRSSVLAGLIDIDSIIVNEDTPSAIIKKDTTILLSQPYDYRQILVDAKFIADSLGFQTFLKNENLLSLNVSDRNIRDISKLLKKKKYTPSALSNTTWEKIQVEEVEIGEYYGFEVDNNNLFVLPDFTVVHNCEFTGRTVIGPDPTLKMGQLGMPREVAQILTIPEQVTNFNYDYLTKLVNDGKVNIVKKKDGERINIHHHIFNRGTRLNHGDIIIRKDEKTGEEFEFENNNGKEILKHGDKLKRNGELIKNIKYPEKRIYHLNVGDICERQLQNGDIVLLNRQPTKQILHS